MTTDYISRAEAKKELLNEATIINDRRFMKTDSALAVLDIIPAADVVPVVRCRDCKYYNAAEQDCDFLFGMVHPEENDYCSNGKLKEGAQK